MELNSNAALNLIAGTTGYNSNAALNMIADAIEEMGRTHTTVEITAAEIQALGTTPYVTDIILAGNSYLVGSYEIVYQAGNIPYGLGISGEATLVGYTGLTFTGNPITDGFLFRVNMSYMATAAKCAAQGIFEILIANSTSQQTNVCMPVTGGAVKLVMLDGSGFPVDLTDGNGTLKIVFSTQVKAVN